MTKPRSPDSLSHIQLFDKGAVNSRLRELTLAFIGQYATEKMRKICDQAKRNFEPIPVCNWHQTELEEEFGEQAQKEAQEVLEKERQSYVDSLSDYIKRTLSQVIRQLRFLVWAVDENGKPYKLQHVIAKENTADGRGNWDYREVEYVGDHDFGRFEQIRLLNHRLAEFSDYVPYFNDELKKLWHDANDLATLEIVRKE